MDSFLRRNARSLAIALATTALMMSAVIDTAASAEVATASSVLTAAKAAIARQASAHIVFTSKSGSSSDTVIVDAGTKSGRETISEGKATATLELNSTYAYIDGNSSGLTTIFGLSAADAKKIGKDWVSMKAGTSQYSSLKSSVTISSVTSVLPTAKGTTVSTSVSKGTKLYVLKWTTKATSSTPKLSSALTVSAEGATLPVKETETASSGSETTTFSKWGEHILVTAPPVASTIAYSKITS
jgi:hypothetical protein